MPFGIQLPMKIWAILLLLGLLCPLGFSDEGDSPNKKLSQANFNKQLQKIQKDYSKKQEQIQSQLENAKTEEETRALIKKMPKPEETIQQCLALMKQSPNNKGIIKVSKYIIEISEDTLPESFYSFLLDHFAQSKEILPIIRDLASDTKSNSISFLEKILEKNPDSAVKAFSCYALALSLKDQIDDSQETQKKVAAYLKQIIKSYPGIQFQGKVTLAKQAESYLFEIEHLSVGQTAPNAHGTNLNGKMDQLNNYRGKVIVLDIWATWCGPCRAMIPHEREMVKKFKDKPFAIISLSADEDKEDLTSFLKKNSMPWTHWWNGNKSEILKKWNIQFYPTIFVIDAKGVIRYKNIREKALEKAVEKLLEETKESK